MLETSLLTPSLRFGLCVAAAIVALDQVTKWLVLAILMQPAPHVIEVAPFFNFVLVWNTGISFGVLSGVTEWMPYALSVVAFGIMIYLILWLGRAERWLVAGGLGLVIGGAVGNVVDRLRFGAVADFLDVHAFGWHFWAFNVADAAISIGVALLIIDGLFRSTETS